MTKTPMQTLIEKLKKFEKGLNKTDNKDGVLASISIAKSLLEPEKEFAEECFEAGSNFVKGAINTKEKNRLAPHDFKATNPSPDFPTFFSQYETENNL